MPDTTDNAKLVNLQPCPFCGRPPATGRTNDGHMWIACETKGCGIAETYMSKHHDALLAMWNRRSDATALAAANALNERLVATLERLRRTAALLCQNSEGCAVNHYGEDFSIHELPGWLADAARDIEEARALLADMGKGK